MNSHWEMGSSFHECDNLVLKNCRQKDCTCEFSLYQSGRQALLDVVFFLIKQKKLSKVYIPSYYCHEVTKLLEKYLQVAIYTSSPIEKIHIPYLEKNSAIILVEYFGRKINLANTDNYKDSVIIIDKTHNPFTQYHYEFKPDYVFGSLRKVLPFGEGGFLYPRLPSPNLSDLDKKAEIALSNLQNGMILKKQYLLEEKIDKSIFLKYFADFEEYLDHNRQIYPISDLTKNKLLSTDFYDLQKSKNKNLVRLYQYFKDKDQLELFENECYFSFFIEKDFWKEFQQSLIQANVYPIVLWPDYHGNLNLINNKVLVSLHADFRYDYYDIDKLIKVLENIIYDFNN
jgi:hypothetical protein